MFGKTLLRRSSAGTFALFAFAATAATAQAADISISDAKIEGGKLVVSGTAGAGANVRLDGRFNATAGGDGAFSFSKAYLPSDCVVSVSSAGASTDAVVANCGLGLTPRGGWNAKADYSANDIVTFQGASWLARRGSSGKQPGEGGDWQLFANGGEAASDEDAGRRVPPTGPAGGDLAGTYPNPVIDNAAVTSPKIANNSVVNSKLANDSVSSAKIVNGAVLATKLGVNAVTVTKIANLAVASSKLANQAVIAPKIANNAVTSAKIANDAVGTAKIADGAVNSAKILDGSVASIDILDGTIDGIDILDGTVASADIADGGVTSTDVLDETLTDVDLASNSVGSAEIQTDAVQATEIANDSIDSGEIADFSLSNQDINVFFAQVNADGTLANSSGGGVTSSRIGAGTYQVDFARTISSCAYVVTQGEAGVGGAGGAITGATDRSGNPEAVFATTRTDANVLADRAFQLVVVC